MIAIEGVLFVTAIGLIFALLLESYSYHRFVKTSKNLELVSKAFNEAFGQAMTLSVGIDIKLEDLNDRLEKAEKGLGIADQNSAIAEIMIDLLAASLNIEEEKWKRVGRLERIQ